MIHSDQGSQFTSTKWQSLLHKHNLNASTSRRGKCHDNAVAKSFFQLLKRERIRQQTYLTRDIAKQASRKLGDLTDTSRNWIKAL